MPFWTPLKPSASESPEQLLTIWRQERAFRVGKVLCYSGLLFSAIAILADYFWSPFTVLLTDVLVFLGCAVSLALRLRTRSIHFWLPAYFAFWISLFPSLWVTGGVASPFFGTDLIALFVFGAVLDSKNKPYIYLIFAVLHIPLFFTIEKLQPLAGLNSAAFELIVTITTVSIAAIVTCFFAVLKTESELSIEFADHFRSLEREKVAKQMAESAGHAKMQFLANMSHEIRTPMNSILGFSELLAVEDCSDKDRTDYLERIRKNGAQLLHLIDDILDLSKFEAGRIPIHKSAISLKDLLEDSLSSFEPALRDKKLRLDLYYNGDPTIPIISDSMRMGQIFTNLLSNAIKFSKRGPLKVTLTVQPVPWSSHVNICFDVEDRGIGMSAENQQNIFFPFRQGNNSISHTFGGTGLGLALSKRIAEALGGKLELVKSEPGVGSHFRFEMNADHATETALEESRHKPVENTVTTADGDGSFAGKRILLVEDSPDNALLVCHYIKSSGAEIDVATDGQQAVAMASHNPYDCILMDVQMPGMDGLEATRQIRRQGFDRSIIALTAHALPTETIRSLDAGCNLHLTKPVKRAELLGALHQQLHV